MLSHFFFFPSQCFLQFFKRAAKLLNSMKPLDGNAGGNVKATHSCRKLQDFCPECIKRYNRPFRNRIDAVFIVVLASPRSGPGLGVPLAPSSSHRKWLKPGGSSSVSFHVVAVVGGGFFVLSGREGGGGWVVEAVGGVGGHCVCWLLSR